ncbi:unnamed protein product [Amoebophrya sp. A120]|nr:unnamed protein product [Amoebophrya sp. A120]|eukprot:GSA120T00022088001.1
MNPDDRNPVPFSAPVGNPNPHFEVELKVPSDEVVEQNNSSGGRPVVPPALTDDINQLALFGGAAPLSTSGQMLQSSASTPVVYIQDPKNPDKPPMAFKVQVTQRAGQHGGATTPSSGSNFSSPMIPPLLRNGTSKLGALSTRTMDGLFAPMQQTIVPVLVQQPGASEQNGNQFAPNYSGSGGGGGPILQPPPMESIAGANTTGATAASGIYGASTYQGPKTVNVHINKRYRRQETFKQTLLQSTPEEEATDANALSCKDKLCGCCWLVFVSPFYLLSYTLAFAFGLIALPITFAYSLCCMSAAQKQKHSRERLEKKLLKEQERARRQRLHDERQRQQRGTDSTYHYQAHNQCDLCCLYCDCGRNCNYCFGATNECEFCRQCCFCCYQNHPTSYLVDDRDLGKNAADVVVNLSAVAPPGEQLATTGAEDVGFLAPTVILNVGDNVGAGVSATADSANQGLHFIGEQAQTASGEVIGNITSVGDLPGAELAADAFQGVANIVMEGGQIVGVVFESAGELLQPAKVCDAFCGQVSDCCQSFQNCVDQCSGVECSCCCDGEQFCQCCCLCNECACNCDCGNCDCPARDCC